MKLHHVFWAAEHDWYVSSRETEYGWQVRVVERLYDMINGTYIETFKTFTDFKALQIWAGY